MLITDLKGKALQKAIKDEREAEWDGKKSVDRQTIIDSSIMNRSQYDSEGNWLGYGEE